MHNVPWWSHILQKSCSNCCKIFKVCLTILGEFKRSFKSYVTQNFWTLPDRDPLICTSICAYQLGYGMLIFKVLCYLIFQWTLILPFPSYRNQSTKLQRESINRFLYDESINEENKYPRINLKGCLNAGSSSSHNFELLCELNA